MFTVELDPDTLAGLSDDELHRLQNDIAAVLVTREATRWQTRLLEHHPGDEEEKD